ncbi:MAG: NAD(P)-dependent oxidoreductase [Candidatus Marsarchaeota archaeon]|nr:NAD(P)-dependent oxidoreductase [Candidatus Marsarchaeota archaeon]
MKVLLTGATGFIGSHVARVLIDQGNEVYAVVRGSSDLRRINDLVSLLHLVPCDLLAFDELDDHFARIQPEVCINSAWYAVPGKYLSAQENLDLMHASIHLATSLSRCGCKRFVGIGTCFEYDTGVGYLSENSPTRPDNLYAATKLALQLILTQLSSVLRMEVAWVRLFYQYGPFEDERRLVASLIRSLLRGKGVRLTRGEQIRDFLHVEDVASAIWAVANSDLEGLFNVGSGSPVAVRDIAARIGAILGRSELIELGALPYATNESMFICARISSAMENTNWIPKYDLEEGLRSTVEWWRRHLEIR